MSHHETDANRATVERVVAAMIGGEWDELNDALDENAVVWWPQSGERLVGRTACLAVYQNYPGGPPTYEISRISGSGDHFTVEGVGDYGGQKVFWASIIEFANGKIVRQTDYWGDPFEAPEWRAQWVSRGDN